MGAMVWWLIPLAATLLAVAWVAWMSRPRPPADTHDSLKEHRRFKEAMERPETSPKRLMDRERDKTRPTDDDDAQPEADT